MPEENISIFRQELERVKTQFEDKFQDIMASVRADRENDKRTLQMVNENINNDRKAINQNRALNDKLETLLNVQNTMLSELRSMNNSIKDLSGGGGGMGLGMGLLGMGLGLGVGNLFGEGGDNTTNGGSGEDVIRTTRGGGDNNTRNSNNETRLPNGVANKEIPLEAQAFLNVLTAEGYEGTERYPNSGYNTIVGRGGQFEGYERHPNRVGIVTSAGPSTAAGRYQIVKRTWDRLTRDYPEILTDFSPKNQDLAAWILAQEDYERRTNGRNLLEDLKTEDPERLAYIERMLSGTWSSLKGGVHEGTAAGRFPELFRQNISDLREEEEADAERVEGDITTYNTITGTDDNRVAVGKIPLRPNDNNARMYHPRYNSIHRGQAGKEWADYSQFLYPVWEDELPEGYSVGQNTRTITDPLTGEERRISFNIIENDGFYTTSGPVIDVDENSPVRISVNSGTNISGQLGGAELPTEEQAEAIYDTADTRVEDLKGNTEGNNPRGADPLLESGDEEVAAFDAHLFGEGGPFTRGEATIPEEPVVTPENDVTGGSTRERIRRDQEQEQEETTTFPTLADQFMRDVRGESPTSMTSMDLAPAVEAALAPNLPEPPTEEDSGETPRRTTTTGGGGGSREQEQPQIEANAIGRFPWAEKIIKYYNLSDMIKTNMLS